MKTIQGVIAILILLLLVIHAQADGLFSLSPTVVATNPGSLLEFTGTITNTTGQALLLDGGTGNITGPSNTALNFDDSNFLNNLPLSLNTNQSYQGQISVQVSPTAAVGQYLFNYTVTGSGASDGTSYMGSDTALISVGSAVPEASTLLSAALMLGVSGLLLWRRKGNRCENEDRCRIA